MENVVSSRELKLLLGVSRQTLSELANRGIVKRGMRRGWYCLADLVRGYCEHLRAEASGRGGETAQAARERLVSAQATLSETKARQLSGELVEADAVEALWASKLKVLRSRILSSATACGTSPQGSTSS